MLLLNPKGELACFHMGFESSEADIFIGEGSCSDDFSCINVCRFDCEEARIESGSCLGRYVLN